VIVGTPQIGFLHVALDELRVAHSLIAPIRLGSADEICCAVDADCTAARANTSRNQQGAVAEAASDIEHTAADREPASAQGSIAVLRKPIGDQMLEATELVEQHGVPCFDHDAIDVCHDVPLQISRADGSAACASRCGQTVSLPMAIGQPPMPRQPRPIGSSMAERQLPHLRSVVGYTSDCDQ